MVADEKDQDERRGTAIGVFADLVAWQVDVGSRGGREHLLQMVVDHLAAATQKLMIESCDCELVNEADWLLQMYRWLKDEMCVDFPNPIERQGPSR